MIPYSFLRGAGVPDIFIAMMDSLFFSGLEFNRKSNLIVVNYPTQDVEFAESSSANLQNQGVEYLPALANLEIEFYSLFISYSTHDQAFAERLHADLQAQGVRCWFAPHDMRGGKKVNEQIDEAIRVHDKLLLILSPASMESVWVNTEISKARIREIRENRRILFPIRLCTFEALRDWECFDADTGKDSAREIREYFIPDFSNWKDHDAYKEAFDRLLKDLQEKRQAGA
jgi:hypothetical protein